MGNKAVLIFVGLLISTAVFILAFFIAYNIACLISPPYLVEENGERHGVMPIGQAIIGLIFAGALSVFSLLVCYKKIIKKRT